MVIPMLTVAGIALSVLLFLYLRGDVRAAARETLERRAGEYHRELREGRDEQIVMLHALRGLFSDVDGVTRDAFAATLEPMRAFFPAMMAAGWLRRVPGVAGEGAGDAYVVEYMEPGAGVGAGTAVPPGWRDALDRA
ncbi:MAG TPA: hypothetical protein VGE72_10245, partial [Azospirillum sp.]